MKRECFLPEKRMLGHTEHGGEVSAAQPEVQGAGGGGRIERRLRKVREGVWVRYQVRAARPRVRREAR